MAGMCQRLLTHFYFCCNDSACMTSKAHLQFQGNQTRIGVRKSNLFFFFSPFVLSLESLAHRGLCAETSHPAFRPELLGQHDLLHRHPRALRAEAQWQLSTQHGCAPPRAEPLPRACSFRAERSREISAGPAHPP